MSNLSAFEQKLKIVTDGLREELSGIRTNRPTTKLVENVTVDYLGSILTIRQVATINIEPPRDIVITPWDKGALPMIEKALGEAGLGLSISPQGTIIRCKLPEMTQERVAELGKLVKSSAESSKIKIRMMRDEANKGVKDMKDEDEKFRTKESVQKQVDIANRTIESLVEAKLKEFQE
ncbi:MAG: hypothetical protein A3B23_04090 [Candidatus Colwellbacteria bacterium RIFCSPLOWO2_01_FULL_48_10]|uniref:Ribosome recycling factor domain-containing protein n=1 Tax=Candidatus Colwellbacteria bacterium RIFCSPLOWO2_01_FULL_48_10 TaxID=1797690 RepID=A0A1G1Z6A3_9BACT|nr:MAG: hypothetical protein A3B23_04090 [Candidatus Colwellbacteria bacterium RIFCSPLOWO2_01_FULL_48_10]